MRIAVGGICHETSTFAQTRTTIDDFSGGFGLFRGLEILDRFRRTNTCIGGFLDAADTHHYEAVPLLWAFAYPSGLVTSSAYTELKQEFLSRLQEEQQRGPIDGVLLDQHGAMVAEGIDDADGEFLAAIRECVGPEVPVVATFDLHGNHSVQRVNNATMIVGFDTYPHVDMNERGQEAATLIVKAIQREIQPVTTLRQIPMFWSTACQITEHEPMSQVLQRVHELEQRPGILSITIATGFPWADVANMGPSVIVNANKDQALAELTADELAGWLWAERERWQRPPLPVVDALREGEAIGRHPIILADHADNTGGGAPGDSVEILRTFLDGNYRDALVLYIVDPESVGRAASAGIDQVVELQVGGKSDPIQGPPVPMTATVRGLSDGAFQYDGPMYAGLTGNMGPSAWIEQNGVHVVLVTAHEQPLGPAFAKSLGIDCLSMKYIAVKSAVHFRASFEAFAGSIFNVDAKAIHTHDFSALDYHKRRRPMFPVDQPSP